jgi:hypothetical protein
MREFIHNNKNIHFKQHFYGTIYRKYMRIRI